MPTKNIKTQKHIATFEKWAPMLVKQRFLCLNHLQNKNKSHSKMIPNWSQKWSKSEPGAPWGDLGLENAPESVLGAFPGEVPTPNYTFFCASGVILHLFGGVLCQKNWFCWASVCNTFSGSFPDRFWRVCTCENVVLVWEGLRKPPFPDR
jgi:hypothetical protein